ncbi:MAG: DUF1826 domain-containing protein [Oleispira antarctica]|nr:DUF1826 domain-containing protein [Oleispira antarctica]MBQ0792947.1 DUF1826 domain-containing protein [Oleispira antarctica]
MPKQQPITNFNISSDQNKYALAASSDPQIWTSFYEENIHIAVWQRTHSMAMDTSINALLALNTFSQLQFSSSIQNVARTLALHMPQFENRETLLEDIILLTDMFACLFDQDAIGLRLRVIDTPMCPRFHVDQIPSRLITTYAGPATEWVPNEFADRSKLGAGNNGLSDEESGLLQPPCHIQSIQTGDVALLKGGGWKGNEDSGLIHRSPNNIDGQKRLLLTLDFA